MADVLGGAFNSVLAWVPPGVGELMSAIGIVLLIVGVVRLFGRRRGRAVALIVAGSVLCAPAVVLGILIPLVGAGIDLILGAGSTATGLLD